MTRRQGLAFHAPRSRSWCSAEPEITVRITDHGLGIHDAVEVVGGNTQSECCFAERGAFVAGLVRNRGRLVVADRRAERRDEGQRATDVVGDPGVVEIGAFDAERAQLAMRSKLPWAPAEA